MKKEKGSAGSTINQAVMALRFFFQNILSIPLEPGKLRYHRRRRRLPVVLTKEEVTAALSLVSGLQHRTVLRTIYSTGLRLRWVKRLG